jgi:hypothetical protein
MSYNKIEENNMKHFIPFTALALIALTACQAPTSEQTLANNALKQPNKTMLTAVAEMMSTKYEAMEIGLSTSGLFTQEKKNSDTDSLLFEETIQFDFSLDAATNKLGTEDAQASLQFDLGTLALSNTYTTNPLSVSNQSIHAIFDQGSVYLDLSEAQDLLPLIYGHEADFLPSKLTFALNPESLLGFSVEPIDGNDVDSNVEAFLPMLDNVPLLTKEVVGNVLFITYEITEADLPDLLASMLYPGVDLSSLSPAEQIAIDMMLTEYLAQIDLNTFRIDAAINLLSNTLTGLIIDIDVALNMQTYEFSDYVYAPEDPYADEYGYVYVFTNMNVTMTTDFDLSLTISVYETEKPIAILISKEEYVDLFE